jgi:hypothetical protein
MVLDGVYDRLAGGLWERLKGPQGSLGLNGYAKPMFYSCGGNRSPQQAGIRGRHAPVVVDPTQGLR